MVSLVNPDPHRYYYFTANRRYIGKVWTTRRVIHATWQYTLVSDQEVTILSPLTV